MKLSLEIDIIPYLRMWKSKDNEISNKKSYEEILWTFCSALVHIILV